MAPARSRAGKNGKAIPTRNRAGAAWRFSTGYRRAAPADRGAGPLLHETLPPPESFDDLRRRLFTQLPHEFSAYRGTLTFANDSRIIAGHYPAEKDIDNYLGLEFDGIGVEEATTLTRRKFVDISTCCRTRKPNWRPRIYATTNPGGVGHAWFRAKFMVPFQAGRETETRFIPARVTDNRFNNADYQQVLDRLTGWQRRAWLDGDWDIAAGQLFTVYRRDAQCGDRLR